jgi:Xaa-Pro aminopeptidase
MSRIARLAATLAEPLLVTGATNVRYLTGVSSSNAALLVESDTATLFTDFRYVEAARAMTDVEVVQMGRNLLADVGGRLAGRRVGFESAHLTYASYEAVASGGAELVPTSGLVEQLRAVKEPDELDAIRAAAAVSDLMYVALAEEHLVGRTEGEIAWWVAQCFHELGAEDVAFATIVASGPNGALPHAAPGSDVIAANTLVTVDAGCVVDGYRSDSTRTFATGALPDDLAAAYELCARAQLDGLAAVSAGAIGHEVDAASRVAIAEAGLAERYGHGLGHGVGLDVHEAPTLRPESTDVLAPGNVVTVEPGIYLPGVGGVRIEDLVIVTDDEPEILTWFSKELITVG